MRRRSRSEHLPPIARPKADTWNNMSAKSSLFAGGADPFVIKNKELHVVQPQVFYKRRSSTIDLIANDSFQRGELLMSDGVQFMSRKEIVQLLPDKCVTVYATTWNLGGKSPVSDKSIDEWLHARLEKFNMYIFSMQEVASTDIFVHHNIVRRLESILGACYAPLVWVRRWGQMLVIFISHALLPFTTDAEFEFVPSDAMAKPVRTKGAIACAFRLFHTSFLIVGCHLSYRTKRERIMDYHKISQSLRFDRFIVRHRHSAVSDFDRVIWLGDLNFRAVDATAVDRMLEAATIAAASTDNIVLANDQLINEMRLNTIFERFLEAPITFAPTYKYIRGTDDRDAKRLPAYTDRILYRANSDIDGDGEYPIKCLKYDCLMERRISDHKPVIAVLKINVVPARKF